MSSSDQTPKYVGRHRARGQATLDLRARTLADDFATTTVIPAPRLTPARVVWCPQ